MLKALFLKKGVSGRCRRCEEKILNVFKVGVGWFCNSAYTEPVCFFIIPYIPLSIRNCPKLRGITRNSELWNLSNSVEFRDFGVTKFRIILMSGGNICKMILFFKRFSRRHWRYTKFRIHKPLRNSAAYTIPFLLFFSFLYLNFYLKIHIRNFVYTRYTEFRRILWNCTVKSSRNYAK